MWIRTLLLMFAIGCAGVGDAAEPTVATVTDNATVNFHCLNHTSIHVVTCSGSISLFPITITIDSLRVLSDNDLTILSDALDDLSVLDRDLLDHTKILDDVEARVIDHFFDWYAIVLDRTAVVVCTVVAGTQVCR